MSISTTSAPNRLASSVFRKALSGLTGLLLILYLAQHLFANIKIFSADPLAVSQYGYALQGFGVFLKVVELGLVFLFLMHIVVGVQVWITKRKARNIDYKRYATKGAPSKQTLASRTMIWGGGVLIIFLVLHVAYFRFGPGIAEGYVATIDGASVRHFERLVTERFQNLAYVVFYCFVMGVVGLHISHGFWSALQSLGLVTERNRDRLYRVGVIIGAVIAIGFISIPLGIYFGGN